LIDIDDRLAMPTSGKAEYIARITNGKNFNSLDRRTRQELVAIDGATVVDHTGTIIAVGAILKVPGGSTGGGRLAAAKQIAKCGFGLKVSQDGGITGFRSGQTEPVFKLM
jgi:DNA integrity scanning protein DisA with diadenylate cyclase activity